jgi:hypothetical protein
VLSGGGANPSGADTGCGVKGAERDVGMEWKRGRPEAFPCSVGGWARNELAGDVGSKKT